jgi:hypothetical protein
MTYQQKLERDRRDSDSAIARSREPGITIGFASGRAGFTAVDQGGYPRTVYGLLDVKKIDDLIDQLELARAHLVHEMPTGIDCEIPAP